MISKCYILKCILLSMNKTPKIIYVNNYGNKNTATLRRAHKANLLDLVFDRNHSSLENVKIYKVFSKKTGCLRAEFHVRATAVSLVVEA